MKRQAEPVTTKAQRNVMIECTSGDPADARFIDADTGEQISLLITKVIVTMEPGKPVSAVIEHGGLGINVKADCQMVDRDTPAEPAANSSAARKPHQRPDIYPTHDTVSMATMAESFVQRVRAVHGIKNLSGACARVELRPTDAEYIRVIAQAKLGIPVSVKPHGQYHVLLADFRQHGRVLDLIWDGVGFVAK